MKNIFILIIFFISSFSFSQNILEGEYKGNITIANQQLEIFVNIKSNNGVYNGTIDIPVQNAKNLPLTNFNFQNPSVYFELDVPNGIGKFQGEIQDKEIRGTFSQIGFEGTFFLTRDFEKKTEEEIKEDVNLPKLFREEDVKFKNDNITLAGTFTYPLYDGRHPAIIMISGSGPQNRDEEIYNFKIFKILAERFSKDGIAVLRYDDRGVGESTGKSVDNYTTEDFTKDVLAAVKYLKTRKDVDPQQIGLLGHSEGGIIAPMAAVRDTSIAFVICLAGPSVNGEEILLEQTKLIMKANNSSDDEIKSDIEILRKLIKDIKTEGDFSEVKQLILDTRLEEYEKLPDAQKQAITNRNLWAESYADMYIKNFNTVWMKYFILLEPKQYLEKLKCPALMLFGEYDLQVSANQNIPPMQNALIEAGNKDYTIYTFEKANHLFQQAITGNPAEYPQLPKEFVPGFLKYISEWLSKRVKVSR